MSWGFGHTCNLVHARDLNTANHKCYLYPHLPYTDPQRSCHGRRGAGLGRTAVPSLTFERRGGGKPSTKTCLHKRSSGIDHTKARSLRDSLQVDRERQVCRSGTQMSSDHATRRRIARRRRSPLRLAVTGVQPDGVRVRERDTVLIVALLYGELCEEGETRLKTVWNTCDVMNPWNEHAFVTQGVNLLEGKPRFGTTTWRRCPSRGQIGRTMSRNDMLMLDDAARHAVTSEVP